ncbi:MAG TPA: hypothetical protein VKQ32_19725 [Polyangia bacterium]|nr:hypothetical protein [Polyangia bacterium]
MRHHVRAFVVLAVGVAGCHSFQNRRPDVPIRPAQMILLPITVMAIELDADEARTVQEDTTDTLQTNIEAAVHAEAAARGIRVFAREMDGQDEATKKLYGRLWGWSSKATLEIAAQATGRFDFGRQSVGDWRFPGDVAPLAAALRADTALTVYVRDTTATTGRTLLKGNISWKKIVAACVVSLRDGRMVWCDSNVDSWGDLKNPGTAARIVNELLAGLGGPGAKVSEPAPREPGA